MRTTISIDDQLLEALKRRAAETGSTVSQLIEDSVRVAGLQESSPPQLPAFELVTFGKGGQFSELNIDKTTALLELEDIERHRKLDP